MKSKNLGLFFGLSAGFLWSFTFLAPKISYQFTSTEILLGRYLIFFMISLAIFPLPKLIRFFKNHPSFLKEALITSTLGFSSYYFILVESVRLVGVPFPSFTMGLVPVTMILLAGNFRRNLKLYRTTLICVFLGMLTLAVKDISEINYAEKDLLDVMTGIALAFLALASWTYYALRNVKFLSDHPYLKSKDWSSILGLFALPTTLICLMIESLFRSQSLYIFQASSQEIGTFVACALAIGIGSSWLATYCWNIAGSILTKEMLGQMVVSETCFAVILNVLYEKRMPYPAELIALLLLSTGVAFAARKKS